MEDKGIYKFFTKLKAKLSKKQNNYPSGNDYVFSSEEIDDINKKNRQKILELKQDLFSNKIAKEQEQEKRINVNEEPLSSVETQMVVESGLDSEMVQDRADEVLEEKEGAEESVERLEEQESFEEIKSEKKEVKGDEQNSFIHLNPDYQKFIMDQWNNIDIQKIDQDIEDGKELLNHNYTITYADEASRYIHHIRKEYEVVICYLIGFNNEKRGIHDKTIFSSTMEEEWKFLNNYIRVLERIRSLKK